MSAAWLGMVPRTNTKNTCLEEIRLCAQNMIAILRFNSQHNWGGGLYDHSMSRRIFTLIMIKIFI